MSQLSWDDLAALTAPGVEWVPPAPGGLAGAVADGTYDSSLAGAPPEPVRRLCERPGCEGMAVAWSARLEARVCSRHATGEGIDYPPLDGGR